MTVEPEAVSAELPAKIGLAEPVRGLVRVKEPLAVAEMVTGDPPATPPLRPAKPLASLIESVAPLVTVMLLVPPSAAGTLAWSVPT